jgi:hypothetical protein
MTGIQDATDSAWWQRQLSLARRPQSFPPMLSALPAELLTAIGLACSIVILIDIIYASSVLNHDSMLTTTFDLLAASSVPKLSFHHRSHSNEDNNCTPEV